MRTRTLVKYVVVADQNGTWLDMMDSQAQAEIISQRTPNTHVERWTYPVLQDGTHGAPSKVKLA